MGYEEPPVVNCFHSIPTLEGCDAFTAQDCSESLGVYSTMGPQIPQECQNLLKNLGDPFGGISFKFSLSKGCLIAPGISGFDCDSVTGPAKPDYGTCENANAKTITSDENVLI